VSGQRRPPREDRTAGHGRPWTVTCPACPAGGVRRPGPLNRRPERAAGRRFSGSAGDTQMAGGRRPDGRGVNREGARARRAVTGSRRTRTLSAGPAARPRLAPSPRSPALFASGPVRPVHRVRPCSSRFSSHRGPTRASGPAVARPAVRPPAPRHPRTARLLRRGSGTPASGVHLARPFRWPVGTRLTGRRPRAERRPNPPAHSPPCIPPAVPGVRRQRGHGASHRPPEPGRAAVRPARPTPRAGRQHRVRRTTLRSRPRG